jgi:Flp pilus assembly protein TadG
MRPALMSVSGNPRSGRDERGVVAVEFALTVVVFLTLVFGMIQYALYFFSAQSAADAAREGARRASVGETCSNLLTRTGDSVQLRETSPALTVTRRYYAPTVTNYTAAAAGTAATGKTVVVVVSYKVVNLNFPFIPFVNGGAVTETAVARVENYNSLVPANWAAC